LIATLGLISTFSPNPVSIPAPIPTLIAVSFLSLRSCSGDHPGAEQNDEGKSRSADYFSKAIESHTQITFPFWQFPILPDSSFTKITMPGLKVA
jgi:hypothetical protein